MSSNPRRTPVTARSRPDACLTLKTNMALRKGATFHSPTTPPESPELVAFRPPSLPRRSHTNLDDVVDAHRRRIALTLSNLDKTLSSVSDSSSASSTRKALNGKSNAVPRSFLAATIDSEIMAQQEGRVLRPRPNRRPARYHDSDSGLGSSIGSSGDKTKEAPSPVAKQTLRGGAVTRSAARASANNDDTPALSDRAANRIIEHTLKPLLAKQSLKEFHPIVLECPRKIQEKEIVCLRDVEKTLLLLAPEKTKVAGLYLDFCLTTIRCIQATVEYLGDREQTRPRDLPYTSGYFIDLVDQIRQYAQQLSDAKDKKTTGAAADEMDLDSYDSLVTDIFHACIANMLVSTDEIKLHGGIHINGRPAELVRVKKDGKAFSMATGERVEVMEDESKEPLRIKRSASEELEDEEEIMRSMARRKKNASPEELAPKKCPEPGCNKEFKRPCDLTKHQKTHSRPWKCPVRSCKYHEYGWPTEKEMDRHHNDKHSDSPAMYECHFKPCPYKSKRESNCKQHMEKAHNWTYVRTKTNGKLTGGSSVDGSTHPTPQLQAMPTPDQSIGIATPPEEHYARFNYNGIEFPSYVPADMDFNMIPQELQLDYSPVDHTTPSTDSGFDHNSAYQDMTADFTLYEDIYAANAQLPTPIHNAFAKQVAPPMVAFSAPEICQPQPAPHFSPSGQGNAMLFTPTSLAEVDEGFEEFPANAAGNNGDFVLFPVAEAPKSYDPLFIPEVPSLGVGLSQHSSQDLFAQCNVDWAAASFQSFSQH